MIGFVLGEETEFTRFNVENGLEGSRETDKTLESSQEMVEVGSGS